MGEWWSDLSDSEVRARLVQRGVPEDVAWVLVEEREDPQAAAEVSRVLSSR